MIASQNDWNSKNDHWKILGRVQWKIFILDMVWIHKNKEQLRKQPKAYQWKGQMQFLSEWEGVTQVQRQ